MEIKRRLGKEGEKLHGRLAIARNKFGTYLTESKWSLAPRRFLHFVNRNRASRIGFSLLCGLVALATLEAAHVFVTTLPDINALANYQPSQSIRIYDRFDKLAAVVPVDQDRVAVPLSEIAPDMKNAMLASEDHKFYKHDGVNLISIGRAAFVNLAAGKVVEGGSTITQQLAKNLFFPNQPRTFDRKLKELVLALNLEKRYPKDKILEMYLNHVYFGRQAYGIESASRRYFSKPASKLTLAESAFLAGLVRAPSAMATKKNLDEAVAHQRIVLDKMERYGFTSADAAAKARKQKLTFRKFIDPYQNYPHYVSYVVQQLRQQYPHDQLDNGLKVYTNLDPKAQEAGEKALAAGVKKAPRGVSQAALVSINVKDGGVIAMVGGVGNYYKYQWNRATSPHTAGSSFKPFVYLTGFMQGVTPDTVVKDEPLSINVGSTEPIYSPQNFDHKFYGRMTVREALAKSRNLCAIRMMQLVGVENVIATARRAGVKNAKLDPYISLALGASAVSPLEMATAYSTFARMGVAMEPTIVRRVEDTDGKILFEAAPKSERVFDPKPVAQLVDVMITAVERGTGTLAKIKGRQIAGKTGTADESKDIWFVGYTPDLCTAVWGGNDDNDRIQGRNTTGGVVMAKMWHDYATRYYASHKVPPIAFDLQKKGDKDESRVAFIGDHGNTDPEKDASYLKAKREKELAAERRLAAMRHVEEEQYEPNDVVDNDDHMMRYRSRYSNINSANDTM